MSKNTRDFEAMLDESLETLRDQRMDDQAESAAFDRVWARIREEAVQASAEAEDERKRQEAAEVAELPSIQKAHDDAKRWLYQDSVSETATRGRAVQQRDTSTRKARRPVNFASWGWRVAAAAAVVSRANVNRARVRIT